MINDTIAAIATASGEAGIGIIRISGPDAKDILRSIFRFRSGRPLKDIVPRKMVYGNIVENADSEDARVIDEAMVVFMQAPFTYTGEDVTEIQCHGSAIALRRILSLVMSLGAAPAERGEFTKRAFLNGRIDLSQAEAVIDVIRARSSAGSEAAVAQLTGRLSKRIKEIRENMADLLSEIAVRIEYPEEDLEEIEYEDILTSLRKIHEDIRKMADTAQTGRVMKDGLRLAIVGRPNVGKSSLMNALLREERAIVTEIPGTTRDTIEEYADLDGIPVKITDTAGIRESGDKIEQIGIARSRNALKTADLVILMVDSSEPVNEEDRTVFSLIRDKKCILALNKSDRPAVMNREDGLRETGLPEDTPVVILSAAERTGIRELIGEIKKYVYGGEIQVKQDILIADARHEQLLTEAMQRLEEAASMLERREAMDFAEMDINEAWMLLGEITGDSVSDDIVNEIFSRFCLGK